MTSWPRANLKFCVVTDPRDPENVLQVDFVIASRGCEAQLYGPPEHCYPAESPELEISAAIDIAGTDVLAALSPEQVSGIEEEILDTYDFEPGEVACDPGRSLYRLIFRSRPREPARTLDPLDEVLF